MFPYFDTLFQKLATGDTTSQEAFGEFVHWGYWDMPPSQPISPHDFYHAAERMADRVLEKVALTDGNSILDVGCGFGGTVALLNGRYHNCTITGINIDPRQLAIAEKMVEPINGNKVAFVEGDACNLPFPDRSFDAIVCMESIFHFSDRKTFFRECERILKPGGRLVVSDFVPVFPLGGCMNSIQHAFHLVDKVYGTMRIDISIPGYRRIARTTGFSAPAITNITRHTLPTYSFLKQNFAAHLPEEERKFSRATRMIEFVSKAGLLRYLILSFTKHVTS